MDSYAKYHVAYILADDYTNTIKTKSVHILKPSIVTPTLLKQKLFKEVGKISTIVAFSKVEAI